MCKYCKAAEDCIEGKYGNGRERREKLEAKGFCYFCVQTLVNHFIGRPCNHSDECGGHCLMGFCERATEIIMDR